MKLTKTGSEAGGLSQIPKLAEPKSHRGEEEMVAKGTLSCVLPGAHEMLQWLRGSDSFNPNALQRGLCPRLCDCMSLLQCLSFHLCLGNILAL